MMRYYKIRLYPNKTQEEKLWKHINCCRFIWNYMLNMQEIKHLSKEKYIRRFSMINLITTLRNDEEHSFLKDVSASSLGIVCTDLDRAYQAFFSGKFRHPKFKSKKKCKKIYPIRQNYIRFKGNNFFVEKVGMVRYKYDFRFADGVNKIKIYNPRIQYTGKKWLLTFSEEYENQVSMLNSYSVGIDLGVKKTAVVSYDEDKSLVFHNINKSEKIKKLKRRLKHKQRALSRKYEANKVDNKYVKTKNILKQEKEVALIYKKMSNIRDNYLHQITNSIIKLFPEKIVMENLNVIGMVKNKHLSEAIMEQCFRKFRDYIEYKCEKNGIKFVLADRFYPSSKTCSCCGTIKSNLKLKDRLFVCDSCGFSIDRDLNAAINLMNYKD